MNKNNNSAPNKPTSKVGFKALDLVIIVLLIASLVGIYFRYNVADILTNGRNQKDCILEFEITNINYDTASYFKVDDVVCFYESGEELGRLTTIDDKSKGQAISISPYEETFVVEDSNQPINVPYQEKTRINAKGRLICRGTFSEDGGFLLNGTQNITEQQNILVKTEMVTVTITVKNIQLAK